MESSPEEFRTFNGLTSLRERSMTSVERDEATLLLSKAKRRRLFARLGCIVCLAVMIASFPLGLAVLPIPITLLLIFGSIGFGLWCVSMLNAASFMVQRTESELEAGLVETFGTVEESVDVLAGSGRVLGGNVPSYGEVRTLGSAPALVGEEGGNRRLSDDERAEIGRLIESSWKPVGIVEILGFIWLIPLGIVVYVGTLEFNPVIPVLVILAAIPSFLVFKRRWEAWRVRGSLLSALEADAFVEHEEEGRRLGLLMPNGIVWTIDGQPSPLRTFWTP